MQLWNHDIEMFSICDINTSNINIILWLKQKHWVIPILNS